MSHRNINKWLLALLFCAAAHCGYSASNAYSLTVSSGGTLPVLYFADHNLTEYDEQSEYAVVVIYGLDGGTSDSASSIRTKLEGSYSHLPKS